MWKLNLLGLSEKEKCIANYLLDDFIDITKKDLSDIELTIKNESTCSYPKTCPKRINAGQREDYIIYLCYAPEHWCQMIYQLAHELGHFFMDCYPEKRSLKWISECLCELFSMIFLNRSISFFHKFSPAYVEPSHEYIKDHLKKSLSYSTLFCSEFVAQKLNELESDPNEDRIKGRPRNDYIAAKLYEALGSDGRGISAVCLFSELEHAESCNEFFDLWLHHCRTNDEKYFITVVQNTLLG